MKYYVRNTTFSIRLLIKTSEEEQSVHDCFNFKIVKTFDTKGKDNLECGDEILYNVNDLTAFDTEEEAIGFATMEFL